MFQWSCNEAVVKLDFIHRHYSSNNNEIKITHESDGHIKRLTICHSTAEWGSKQTNIKSIFLPYDPKISIS